MAVGELKKALEGVPDDYEVTVDVAHDVPPYEFRECFFREYENLKMFCIYGTEPVNF